MPVVVGGQVPKAAKITSGELRALGFTAAQIKAMPQSLRNVIGNSIITGVGASEPPGIINPHPATIKVGSQTKWIWASSPAAKAASSTGLGALYNPYKPTNNWLIDIIGGLVGGDAIATALGLGSVGAGAAEASGAASEGEAAAGGAAAGTGGAAATGGTAGGVASKVGSTLGKAAASSAGSKLLGGLAITALLEETGLWKGIAMVIAGMILVVLALRQAAR